MSTRSDDRGYSVRHVPTATGRLVPIAERIGARPDPGPPPPSLEDAVLAILAGMSEADQAVAIDRLKVVAREGLEAERSWVFSLLFRLETLRRTKDHP